MTACDDIADLEQALLEAKRNGSDEDKQAAMTALREARRAARTRKERQARVARRRRGLVSGLVFAATVIGVAILLASGPGWLAAVVFLVAAFALAVP